MLFTIENFEGKADRNRNRKSGSELGKNNRNYNRSRATEAFGMANLETNRNISVGRIF